VSSTREAESEDLGEHSSNKTASRRASPRVAEGSGEDALADVSPQRRMEVWDSAHGVAEGDGGPHVLETNSRGISLPRKAYSWVLERRIRPAGRSSVVLEQEVTTVL